MNADRALDMLRSRKGFVDPATVARHFAVAPSTAKLWLRVLAREGRAQVATIGRRYVYQAKR